MTTLKQDPKRWAEGFQDAYAGHASRVLRTDDHSYASGRVEGDALRARHRQEFEQQLFMGRRSRPVDKTP